VSDFFTVTRMIDRNEWKLPINLTIGFHLFIYLSVIYLPQLFKPAIKYPEIYSVKLVNIVEPQAEAPPVQPQVKQVEKTPPKIKEIKIKPVEIKKPKVVVKPKPKPAPVKKAVSIKPLKRKKRKKIKKRPPPDKTAERKLKRAKELERKAEREARLAAQQVEKIKSQIRRTNRTVRGSRQANISNLLESRYQAQIFSRLQQYWSLPDHKPWDPNLSALVVITIQSDGKVTNRYFEKKSGDRYFDQFVVSTLQKAGDMPPIPPALRRPYYKIGLRFKPESIQ